MSEEISALASRLLRSNAYLVSEYEEDARLSAEGLKTGFDTVLTGFYNKGDTAPIVIPRKAITFFVGKSGGGKTTGMLNYSWRLIKKGYRGAFISLEEPAVDLFAKMMSLCSRAEFRDESQWDDFFTCKKTLGRGFETWRHASKFKNYLGDNLRFLDATKYLGDDLLDPSHLQDPRFLGEFLKAAKDLGDGNEFDFIMIDYAQLMDTGENKDSMAIMMKKVSHALRGVIGANPKTALIIGAQLNRAAAFIEFAEWQKEHIAEGSDLEKAANTIIAFALKDFGGRTMMGQRFLKNRGGNPMMHSMHDCDLRYYYISEEAHHDPDVMG